MSARAIPAHLEGEVITRHIEGHSLRSISAWLQDSHRVTASREAVSGVLHRGGIHPEEVALSEVTRQLGARTDDLTTQLFECLGHYRQLMADSLSAEPPKHLKTALQTAKAWAQLLMWSLRAAGAQLQVKPTPDLERQVRLHDVKRAHEAKMREHTITPKPAPPPPAVPSSPAPPRNQPCTCGSGLKWKKCCGSPAPLSARSEPLVGLSG